MHLWGKRQPHGETCVALVFGDTHPYRRPGYPMFLVHCSWRSSLFFHPLRTRPTSLCNTLLASRGILLTVGPTAEYNHRNQPGGTHGLKKPAHSIALVAAGNKIQYGHSTTEPSDPR